jgi:hypothetical protein
MVRPTPTGAAPTAEACSNGSALAEIACELKRAFPAASRPSALVVASAKPDAAAEFDAAKFVEKLTRVVAGSVGGSSRSEASTVAEARRRAPKGSAVLFLVPTLKSGRLGVEANLYPPAPTFWERVKQPHPVALSHAFVERAADAEIRSLLPRPALVAESLHLDEAPAPERRAVALACGHLDAESGDELVFVGRRLVSRGTLRGGKFVSARQTEWSKLAQVAAAPLREPIATVFVSDARATISSSDRARPVVLGADLTAIPTNATPTPSLSWSDGTCSAVRDGAVSGKLESCDGSRKELPNFGEVLDAIAATELVDADGKVRTLWAGRSLASSKVTLLDSRGGRVETAELGAQLALGDLDGDGNIELIASSNTTDPTKEELTVWSWTSRGLTLRLKRAIPEGIRALAACPWQGAGISPIAVATDTRLWVLR